MPAGSAWPSTQTVSVLKREAEPRGSGFPGRAWEPGVAIMANVDVDAADPNLVPLLDVVLQLIMFFMITVNFVRVDQFDDTIALPVAQMAVPLDKSSEVFIFLNLDSTGKLVGALSS